MSRRTVPPVASYIEVTCDVCGKKTEDQITADVYCPPGSPVSAGRYDVCASCITSILDFLQTLSASKQAENTNQPK